MPTLAEIRDSLLSQLTGHIPSDDHRIRYGMLDKILRDKRSQVVNSQARNGLGVESAYYQIMDCLTIKSGEIECDGEGTGFTFDYVDLPDTESFQGAIAYLGPIDGATPFQARSFNAFMRPVPERFCNQRPIYTIVSDRAYIRYQPAGLEKLRLNAVLTDPATNSCILNFENTIYPIPAHMVPVIETICLKQLLSTLPIAGDIKNDGADLSLPTGRVNPNNL